MGNPCVSVLMTAYNREKYIGAAIESVLASSYRDFELIIVDDRSKDNTVNIAQGYQEKDLRVKVYVNEKNLGDYPNRNKAASYAQGKYIKYLDADDYIYPWGLELMVSMMEKFPEAGWGLCSLPQFAGKPYPFQLEPGEAYKYHYQGPGLFHKAPLSAILKKGAFDHLGGFSNRRMVGDSEMWHRMALHFPVVLMPDGIVWYRAHNSQEVNSKRKFILEYEKIVVEYMQHPDCPLTREERRWVIVQRKKAALKLMIFSLLKFRIQEGGDHFKIWRFYLGK
jgi:glycosyltransferase involved in cell wall biosynthesis